MAERKQPQQRRKPYKPRQSALNFSVWSANGSPIPEVVMSNIESKLQEAIFEAFNQGVRLLTQTAKV